jgi:hypothetical protein
MSVPSNFAEDAQARQRARETQTRYPTGEASAGRRRAGRGRTAVEQARLVLLVMINVAQLWILAATVEAALARSYRELLPLVVASGVCWLISLSIILWWRPASRRHTSTGYIRERRK